MQKPHQRKNTTSNTQVGIDFEALTYKYFQKEFPSLEKPFLIPIGHIEKKEHKFDMGCSRQKVTIECKSHTWTEGGNTLSAKLTTWDQAMLYFFLAPRGYRKLFVIKRNPFAPTTCAPTRTSSPMKSNYTKSMKYSGNSKNYPSTPSITSTGRNRVIPQISPIISILG